MAVLAFAVVGQFLGGGAGTVGGFIGATVGSALGGVVDQTLLFPAVFGKKNQSLQGPRLDELQLTTASEGSPMNFVMGTMRCAGTLIWAGDLEEVQTEEHHGGKGGGDGGVGTTTFTYYTSLAVGVCEGPIQGFLKVWADGKVIWQSTGFRNLLRWSDVFQNTDVWERDHCAIAWNVDTAPNGKREADRLKALDDDAACTQKNVVVRPGTEYTFSFYAKRGSIVDPQFSIWDDTNDNYVVGPSTFSPSDTNYDRITTTFTTPDGCHELHVSVLDHCGTIGTLYVWGAQLEKGATATTYDPTEDISFANDPQYDKLVGYPGTDTQGVDPTIEAIEGAGNVPAFRDTGYIVIDRLNLTNFGNRIPQFNFLVKETLNNKPVKEGIGRILTRAGWTDYDVSGVGRGTLQGFITSGPQVSIRLLEQLVIVYSLIVQERDGIIYFMERSDEFTPIPAQYLTAQEDGEEVARTATIDDVAGFDIPSEVILQYYDKKTDYQRGSARAQRNQKVNDSVFSIDIPIVLNNNDASSIAKRLLWQGWVERQQVEINMAPNMSAVQEGDRIEIPIEDQVYLARVIEITRGANFVTQLKSTVEIAKTLKVSGNSYDLIVPAKTAIYQPQELKLMLADIPALREQDLFQPGIYFGVSLPNQSKEWRGAGLLFSPDNIEFNQLASVSQQATMGKTLSTLGVGEPGIWDDANTVDVELYYGTLESIPDQSVLNGKNWILIRNEIIGFANAELIGERQYRLSRLIRGLRSTQSQVGVHVVGDPVLLLSSTMGFIKFNQGALGQLRYFRAVPTGGIVENFDSQYSLILSGNTMKCFAPVSIAGTRDGSNNLTISWARSSRALNSVFGPTAEVLLPDERNDYIVEIFNGSALVRSFSVTNDTEVEYSAVDQTADGIVPGVFVGVRIFQLSSTIGRGIPGLATV